MSADIRRDARRPTPNPYHWMAKPLVALVVLTATIVVGYRYGVLKLDVIEALVGPD